MTVRRSLRHGITKQRCLWPEAPKRTEQESERERSVSYGGDEKKGEEGGKGRTLSLRGVSARASG